MNGTQGSLYGRYQELDVMTMSAPQLVVLSYSHLAASLRQAAVRHDAGDIEGRSQRLGRAAAIAGELLDALDRDRGGDLASQLAGLYVWMIGEINAIEIRPDRARLDRVIQIVDHLHEAWAAAAAQVGTAWQPAA